MSGFVFYDENGNGTADPTETVRLPGVGIVVGGVTTSTVEGGRFSVSSVQNGTQTAQASPASLPAYFTPGAPLSVTVPSSSDVAVPAVLPIGSRNRPNVYLAFGDSITFGDSSSDGSGYRDELRAALRAYWGKADITNDGGPGHAEQQGRVAGGRQPRHPSTRLPADPLRDERLERRAVPQRVPVLHGHGAALDGPAGTRRGRFPDRRDDPAREPDLRSTATRWPRNDWVSRMNELVRAMAKQERAPIAEIHGDFLKQPSLAALFDDDKHPNDVGYRVIARAFFDAITKPLSASGSGRAP